MMVWMDDAWTSDITVQVFITALSFQLQSDKWFEFYAYLALVIDNVNFTNSTFQTQISINQGQVDLRNVFLHGVSWSDFFLYLFENGSGTFSLSSVLVLT